MADNYELFSSDDGYPSRCCFGLELTKNVSNYPVSGRPQAYRLLIEVSRWSNIDPNIFLYKVNPADYGQGERTGEFDRICSPVDLEEYPAGEPPAGTDVEYFRLSTLDLLFRSEETLEDTWDAVLTDRNELVRTITQLCEAELDLVTEYGCFSESSSSLVPGAEPESSESSGSEVAEPSEPDPIQSIEVITSDDPEYPVGALFGEVPLPLAAAAARGWMLAAETTAGAYIGLVTRVADNQTDFKVVHPSHALIEDSEDLADNYGLIFSYIYDNGVAHTLILIGRTTAIGESSSESSSSGG